ncbi:MAG: cytochrome c-type biogenesis protein CcmH [Alphaproteobacteria bacterium]|nr:cytochrome c-type biogenesis protein CcmH [Alphaproteobacteria bacterium]
MTPGGRVTPLPTLPLKGRGEGTPAPTDPPLLEGRGRRRGSSTRIRLRITAPLFVFVAFLLLGNAARALGIDPPLPDPAQEARAVDLHKALRCLVCQNQSIHDSNAGLATDLRRIVRERITAGDSDKQVIDYVVTRYGDWVLLKPPLNVRTAVLWAAPVILILLGAGFVASFHRRNRNVALTLPTPLSDAERARLNAIMSSDEPPPAVRSKGAGS